GRFSLLYAEIDMSLKTKRQIPARLQSLRVSQSVSLPKTNRYALSRPVIKNSQQEFFPKVSKIKYEGAKSKNPLSFKHYNASEKVEGKTMREHLRFAVCYWHTMRNVLSDPFGAGTAVRPWDDGSNSVSNAQRRVRAAFEFIEKLGAPF